MLDLETWGGERGKEIDETIKFRRKIGKKVAIKKRFVVYLLPKPSVYDR